MTEYDQNWRQTRPPKEFEVARKSIKVEKPKTPPVNADMTRDDEVPSARVEEEDLPEENEPQLPPDIATSSIVMPPEEEEKQMEMVAAANTMNDVQVRDLVREANNEIPGTEGQGTFIG